MPLLAGFLQLARLAWRTRFRFRSDAYWQWRHETAFGHDPAGQPTPAERRRLLVHYARWVGRMRRLG